MIRRSVKHVVGSLAVAGLMLLSVLVAAQEATPPAQRAAVPEGAAQNEARKLLGDLFRPDYERAKKPDEKAALADKMVRVGTDTRDDPVGQYMLFQIAKEIAIGAASADVALRAIDAQGAVFEINVPEEKLATVTTIEKNVKFGKDRQTLKTAVDQLVGEYLQAERYDLAKSGVTLALELARKIPDPAAIKQAATLLKEIDAREKLFGEVRAARKVLETMPDDPAANVTVGRFLWLVEGDEDTGLPQVAKYAEAKLKAVAEEELAQPQDADKQMELADAWWDLAEQESGPLQNAMQQRAVAWYEIVLPQLTGPTKLKVTGRLKKIADKPDEGGTAALPPLGKGAARPTLKLLTNSIGMQLVLIPAGTFTMGSPEGEKGHTPQERQHRVKITKPFYLGVKEVTQKEWVAVMGTKPWEGRAKVTEGDNHAALYISWGAATEFCERLSTAENKRYRLPTEAEWEYAYRGGTTTTYPFGDDDRLLTDYAWYNRNSRGLFNQVGGQKQANPWGLFDMAGNVWEHCSDWKEDHPGEDVVDPQGPATGLLRVARGGSYGSDSDYMRSAARLGVKQANSTAYIGLRVVREP